MPWTLQMADRDGIPLEESRVVLDVELLEYLHGIQGFPYLQGLNGVDPDDETYIDDQAREALATEVAELSARVERRQVQEPPDWVGMEGTGDRRVGEELGWRGLADLLRRVQHLLHLCHTLGLELWMVPED